MRTLRRRDTRLANEYGWVAPTRVDNLWGAGTNQALALSPASFWQG
jgi:hypothetical protein